MDNKLFLLALTCLLTSPLAAMEEGAGLEGPLKRLKLEEGVVSHDKPEMITVKFSDDDMGVKINRLILEESKTIKDLLEDIETNELFLGGTPITQESFNVILPLMEQLNANQSDVIKKGLNSKNITELSELWNISNYLDLPQLLTYVDKELKDKIYAQVKQNPQSISVLLQQLPVQLKRSKVGFPIDQLPKNVRNQLITLLEKQNRPEDMMISTIAIDPLNKLVARAYSVQDPISRHLPLGFGIMHNMMDIFSFDDQKNIRLIETLKLDDKVNFFRYLVFDSSRKLLIGTARSEISIFDFSNLKDIRKISSLDFKSIIFESSIFDRASSFEPKKNLVAVAGTGRVSFLNISNPNEIKLIKELEVPGHPRFSVFDPEQNLFIVGSEKGAFIYDISDLTNIKELKAIVDKINIDSGDIDSRRKLLALGSLDGATLYDISDPSTITQLTTIPRKEFVPTVVFDSKHDLLAVSEEYTKIFDISDLNNIYLLNTLPGLIISLDPHNNLIITEDLEDHKNVYFYDFTLLDKLKSLTFEQVLVLFSKFFPKSWWQNLPMGARAALSYFTTTKIEESKESEDIFERLDPDIKQLIIEQK